MIQLYGKKRQKIYFDLQPRHTTTRTCEHTQEAECSGE